MPDASPRSVTNSPVSFHVSQSCGRHTRARRAHASGSLAVQPRQLRDRERGDRHRAARRAPTLPSSPSCSTQPLRVGRRLGVVPELRRAARPRRRASSTTSPCCWPATATASTSGSAGTRRGCSASHHASGSCSLRGGVVGGCGARPSATSSPVSASRTSTFVDCVDESTPSTSGIVSRTLMRVGGARARVRARRRRRRSTPTARCCSPTCSAAACTGLRADGAVDDRRARSGAASAASRSTPTAASSCSGRDIVHVTPDGATAHRAARRRRRGLERPLHRRGRARCTRARCASRCSTAHAEVGARRAVAHRRRGRATSLFGDVDPRERRRGARPTARIYHSATRASTAIVHRCAERRRNDATSTCRAFGHPDGMALDENGALWLALVGGGARPLHARRRARPLARRAVDA